LYFYRACKWTKNEACSEKAGRAPGDGGVAFFFILYSKKIKKEFDNYSQLFNHYETAYL